MKKNYFLILLTLLCSAFSTARAGVTVEAIGTPITSLSDIKEGDYIAFQEPAGKFLFNYKYNTSATDYVWRPQFNKGNFEAALGTSASEQYVWKVVDMDNSGGSLVCLLQNHIGTYLPVLDNSEPAGHNYCSEEGDSFTFAPGSEDGTWNIKDSQGNYFTMHNWGHLSGSTSAMDFKIYKPTVTAGKETVKIQITAYDEDGNNVPAYDKSMELAIGETFTVPGTGYGYSFVSFANEATGDFYKEGDVITVSAAATYIMTVRPWPTITFAYYNEAGEPIIDKDSGEPAKYTSIYKPGETFYNVGGLYGYYVPQETLQEYQAMTVTDDMDGMTFKITLKVAPWVTVRYVDENDNDIYEKYENYGQPGESIPVPTISWYTLSAADSSYVYNYDTGEGYTVGTENVDIVLHYTTDPLPFQPTTLTDGALAADTKWYTIRFRGNRYMNSSLQLVENKAYGSEATTVADEDQWAFVGSLTDGFAIYNKATGTKTLHAEKVENGAAPTMSDQTSLFFLRKTNDGSLSFALTGMNEYAMTIDFCLNDYEGKGNIAFYGGQWGGTSDAGAHVKFIPVSDIETDIQHIEATGSAANTAIFDLSGRRVSNAQKGIYIIGGKKVIVK